MSAFKNEFRLRTEMTINMLQDGELKGEGCYNLSKFMMISYEVLVLKGSDKLATICAGLLSEFSELAKRYNANSDAPIKLSQDYQQRLRRMLNSVDKIIAEGRISDLELAKCAIKIGEILQDHEIKHGMLPAQDSARRQAGEILAGNQNNPAWTTDAELMRKLPPNVSSKIAEAGGIPSDQMAVQAATTSVEKSEFTTLIKDPNAPTPADAFQHEGW